MKRISNIISVEEIGKWKVNDIITINAKTGSGKSYFIKNVLSKNIDKEYRILIIVPRTLIKNQFICDIEDELIDNIDIISYQHLEELYRNDDNFNFNKYKYIVCDEFQFFLADADFNIWTDISFKQIIETTDNIKIFMSATGDDMKSLINNYYDLKTKDYNIKPDYSNIKLIKYFNTDGTMESLVNECIAKNQKAIVFIENAKKCYETYRLYKDNSIFNCSKGNKNGYYKYVDKDKISNMIKNKRFDENILFTTCCLDSGVSIIDEEVKHIIIDVKNTNSLIQCAGRKRCINGEKFYLYVKNRTDFELSNMLKSLKGKSEKAMYLYKNGQESFVNKYKRNTNSDMIYDIIDSNGNIQKKINMMMLNNNINRQHEIEEMKNSSYIKYINKIFGKRKGEILEEVETTNKLEKYLKSIIGEKLYKENQKELIDEINLKDSLGRQQKSIGCLNSYLIENFNTQIISKVVSENGKKRRCWILSFIK